jgi:hypothetical protein
MGDKYKLFTFLSVDMEILTPFSSLYTLWRYRLLKGVKISISTDRNVNNEFIPGYGKKIRHCGPRKSDVFFVVVKNKQKI